MSSIAKRLFLYWPRLSHSESSPMLPRILELGPQKYHAVSGPSHALDPES
jgi:hypothetical protein